MPTGMDSATVYYVRAEGIRGEAIVPFRPEESPYGGFSDAELREIRAQLPEGARMEQVQAGERSVFIRPQNTLFGPSGIQRAHALIGWVASGPWRPTAQLTPAEFFSRYIASVTHLEYADLSLIHDLETNHRHYRGSFEEMGRVMSEGRWPDSAAGRVRTILRHNMERYQETVRRGGRSFEVEMPEGVSIEQFRRDIIALEHYRGLPDFTEYRRALSAMEPLREEHPRLDVADPTLEQRAALGRHIQGMEAIERDLDALADELRARVEFHNRRADLNIGEPEAECYLDGERVWEMPRFGTISREAVRAQILEMIPPRYRGDPQIESQLPYIEERVLEEAFVAERGGHLLDLYDLQPEIRAISGAVPNELVHRAIGDVIDRTAGGGTRMESASRAHWMRERDAILERIAERIEGARRIAERR